MRFTQKDIAVLVSMSLAIIIMSMVFPAIGLSDESVSSGDIPELSVETNTFDFAGELPQSPGTPSQGTISWDHETGTLGDTERTLSSGDNNATLALATLEAPDGGAEPGAVFTAWSADGTQTADNEFHTAEEGTTYQFISSDGWDVDVTFTSITEVNTGVWDYTVQYNVRDRPESSSGWLSSIPVIGGLFDAGESVASGLVWVGSIIWWGTAAAFEITLNVLSALTMATVFLIETQIWLFTTYTAIILGADGIVGVFMTVPALILSFELTKILFLGIALLPTT